SGASQVRALGFYSQQNEGTSRVRFVGNTISQAGKPVAGSGIMVYAAGGALDVRIHNNSVHEAAQSTAGGASGILLYTDGRPKVDASVVGNTVVGSRAAAFMLWNRVAAGGHVRLDLFDNSFSHSRQGIVITEDVPGTTAVR